MNIIISVDNNQSGIYRIRNKVNGKFYIGSTSNMRKRMREHLSSLRRGIHVNDYLQHAFNKYGEKNFIFEVYEFVEHIDDLLDVEQKLLDELRPYDSNVGYNLSEYAYSYRAYGENNPHYGVPKTEEHKQKISRSLKGHIHSKETRLKISKAVRGKNTGKDHWSYGKERSENHRKNLSRSLKGKFAGENNPFYGKKHTKETKRKLGIPVIQLSKDGEFIARHETMEEAANYNKISKSHISCCCKGKRKTTGGYRWMYAEDYEKKVTQ